MTEYERVSSSVESRIAADPRIRALRKKIEQGTATLADSSKYSQLCAQIMGQQLSGEVLGLSDREGVCTQLLRDRYSDINQVCEDTMRSVDARAGVNMNPRRASFPEERVQQLAHSLTDPTVPDETIQRRADTGAANIAISFHDDFVKENAAFRSDAGYESYITRVVGGASCPWCSGMAGRYKYDEMPDDMFRRHDNCTCTVTFEQGSFRQDVWSKRSWEAPETGAGAEPPKVFSQEEANRLEQERLSEYRGLTSGGEGGIMESELGRFRDSIKGDNRMTDDYYKALKSRFSHGSDDAKAVFNKFVHGDSVENAYYTGVPCFNPITGKISMNYESDLNNSRGRCVTWFHEHGHLIDNAAGNISNDPEFIKLLNDDYLAYMRSYGKKNDLKTFDEVQLAISNDLNSMRKHSAVSDIIQGVSKGNIQGIAGHSYGYWTDDSVICSEAFAHMFEAQFDQTRYQEMKIYFPGALKKFEAMLGGLLK